MNANGQPLRWGQPPLALVPAALAGRLATVPLPDWIAELLDGRGTPAAALTADAWDRLPRDETSCKRIRRHVITLVGALRFELRDVVIGAVAGVGAGAVPPVPRDWPVRARQALIESGTRPDLGRTYAVTFGELLEVPHVGVCTALEAAALLELTAGPPVLRTTPADGPAYPRTHLPGTAVLPILRWGRPGCALLPRSLRKAFATTALPASVSRELHLPPSSTALALDASVWERVEEVSGWTEEYLLSLVDCQWVRTLRVMDEPWPWCYRPDDVPWPKRLRHGLSRAGLLRGHLDHVTYGDLLAIPAIGRKSAIEFGVIADSLVPPPVGPVDHEVRKTFLVAAREEWTDRIRADDARFRDVVPPHDGSLRRMLRDAFEHPESRLAHALACSLDRIRDRADEIGSEPIDQALCRLAGALGISARDISLTATRLGLHPGGRRTLHQVALEHSLSRERVRQLVERTTGRIGQPYLPQVGRAARLLAERAPLTDQVAAQLLVEEGLSNVPIDPGSLRAFADLTGYDVPYRIDDASGVAMVLSEGSADARAALAAARRQAAREGVATLAQVRELLESRGQPWSAEAVEALLRSAPGLEFLDDRWFWVPGAPAARNPLRNATRRMLSVTPQLDIETVRQGLARRSRHKRASGLAPVDVLAAYFSAHPEFVLAAGRTVEAAEPIDYREVLGDGEQAFVEALRAAPGGFLSRTALREAAIERGVNDDNFSSLTLHSPILDHLARDVWCLRGAVVDAPSIEAALTPTAPS